MLAARPRWQSARGDYLRSSIARIARCALRAGRKLARESQYVGSKSGLPLAAMACGSAGSRMTGLPGDRLRPR
jgi:hypothetical protein